MLYLSSPSPRTLWLECCSNQPKATKLRPAAIHLWVHSSRNRCSVTVQYRICQKDDCVTVFHKGLGSVGCVLYMAVCSSAWCILSKQFGTNYSQVAYPNVWFDVIAVQLSDVVICKFLMPFVMILCLSDRLKHSVHPWRAAGRTTSDASNRIAAKRHLKWTKIWPPTRWGVSTSQHINIMRLLRKQFWGVTYSKFEDPVGRTCRFLSR